MEAPGKSCVAISLLWNSIGLSDFLSKYSKFDQEYRAKLIKINDEFLDRVSTCVRYLPPEEGLHDGYLCPYLRLFQNQKTRHEMMYMSREKTMAHIWRLSQENISSDSKSSILPPELSPSARFQIAQNKPYQEDGHKKSIQKSIQQTQKQGQKEKTIRVYQIFWINLQENNKEVLIFKDWITTFRKARLRMAFYILSENKKNKEKGLKGTWELVGCGTINVSYNNTTYEEIAIRSVDCPKTIYQCKEPWNGPVFGVDMTEENKDLWDEAARIIGDIA